MSLLDDLKRQAEQLQNSQDPQAEARRQETVYQEQLRPRMRAILRYLMELTEQLKVVDPDVRQTYDLPGIGEVRGLKQGDYVVNADSTDQTKSIRLRCQCTAEQEGVYAIRPKSQADETREFLESQSMRYAEWPIRDNAQQIIGINFQLTIQVSINFIFQVDPEQGVIRMITANFERFGVERRVIKPERIDEQWLDKLGYYLLRQDQGLHKLEIQESHKAQIREKLEADRLAREQELELALQQEQTESEVKRKTGLLGKLRQLTKR